MDLRSIINTEGGDGSRANKGTPMTPVQPASHNELRSPAAYYSAQSPYQQTPSGSMTGGQYPFPQHHTPQSPAQHRSYPNPLHHRESYPQPKVPPTPVQQHNSYGQPSPVPHTPPVATQNPYLQNQRSQSSHSNSTPTSAHSQQQYFNQHPHDSPVSAGPFSQTQLAQHHRPQSLPGTPLGPPMSTQRQGSIGYPQPSSPYQQRPPSSGVIQPQFSTQQASPVSSKVAPIPNHPGAPSYDLHQNSPTEVSRRSQRERSLSISPKTQPHNILRNNMAISQPQSLQNGQTPTSKRKMDDREISEPSSGSVSHILNGDQSSSSRVSTMSPQQPAKKRIRYHEPPIWARSSLGRVKNNIQVEKRQTNGKPTAPSVRPPLNTTNGNPNSVGHDSKPAAPNIQTDFKENGPLGPWEPSITGEQPYEEVSKLVADWLFLNVVNRPDTGELASRGVEVEIEAKLGQLINKETNERLWLPVQTECILLDNGRVGFKSSMTEAQHKTLNDFLNGKVRETHPDNPGRSKLRVPVVYAHRRERDRFYELPAAALTSLPPSIKSKLNPRHAVKVRVSYDQKTGQELARIIKARVADLDLYNPRFPLDCRISVNLEMRYDGSLEGLIPSSDSSPMPDRNKDRLSYTQSHYQIDLTQVTVADASLKTEIEHELEIELSAAAVREQGRRAMNGEPHQYAELVQGLMDNVRVLSRAVPDHSATL